MSLAGAAALTGCGVSGSNEAVVDISSSTTTELGTIQGSNYGGHAPVTGSRVFVLEATTTGYGAKVKSLLSASYSGSYPTAQDTTSDVTSGLYYVTTDSTGSFNITGDYTCDAGKPVYLYASGGNPATKPAVTLTGFSITSNVVTFTGSNLLYQGESITVAGVPSAYNYLNGTYTVSSTGLTTSQFEVSLTHANVSTTTLSSGTATQANAPSNPAIVNMAMLGICPSSGNFSTGGTVTLSNGTSTSFSPLAYVYMNEVSTVAMSYAMAGFAVDSLHIGSSSTNLMGLQNAALNAGVLYNIQGGGPVSSTLDGEGHIANETNPNNSNGSVPYKTINTLANIVANCVDSANTSVGTTSTALQAESPGCSGLFETATNNGIPYPTSGYGTIPIDTATAMINVAHYPAGINTDPANTVTNSANPSALYNLPTGNVPYLPQLATQPTDWTIALTYSNISTPTAIAIDGSGDAYVGSNTTGVITELSAQGALQATSSAVPSLSGIAVSPTLSGAYTVWATSNTSNAKNVYEFKSSLSLINSFASAYTLYPTALAIDKSGNVYVGNDAFTPVGASNAYNYYYLSEFNSSGTLINTPACATVCQNSGFASVNGMALTSGGSLWLSQNNNTFELFPNPSTGSATATAIGGTTNISAIAVDYQGYAWVTANEGSGGNQDLMRTTSASSGTVNSYGVCAYDNCSIGGLNDPVAVAVDGSNANNSNTFNVWVANSGNSTVTEVWYNPSLTSPTSTTLSPSTGYQSGTGLISTPTAIAVDNSGNVWVTNKGNSTVTEIIGSANPVTTPLSLQQPGVEP